MHTGRPPPSPWPAGTAVKNPTSRPRACDRTWTSAICSGRDRRDGADRSERPEHTTNPARHAARGGEHAGSRETCGGDPTADEQAPTIGAGRDGPRRFGVRIGRFELRSIGCAHVRRGSDLLGGFGERFGERRVHEQALDDVADLAGWR